MRRRGERGRQPVDPQTGGDAGEARAEEQDERDVRGRVERQPEVIGHRGVRRVRIVADERQPGELGGGVEPDRQRHHRPAPAVPLDGDCPRGDEDRRHDDDRVVDDVVEEPGDPSAVREHRMRGERRQGDACRDLRDHDRTMGKMPHYLFPSAAAADSCRSQRALTGTYRKGGGRDSNPRPPGPQPGALPTELPPPRERQDTGAATSPCARRAASAVTARRGLGATVRPLGPVAQWIERQTSNLRAKVRLLPGPLRLRLVRGRALPGRGLGSSLMAACPSCGHENPDGAKFCMECATPLTAPCPCRGGGAEGRERAVLRPGRVHGQLGVG